MCLMAAFVPHRSNKYFHVMASSGIVSSSPYISSPIASARVFEPAFPTRSVRDRTSIVLNHHRFWGYASGPSSSGNTLPSSIHGHAARRSALPRERFSPLAQSRLVEGWPGCPLPGAARTSSSCQRALDEPRSGPATVAGIMINPAKT